MSRAFAYCRVSKSDQYTDNQLHEIHAAGFNVEPRRVVTETVSGSTPALERAGFKRLVDRLEASDVLIVTKLDRWAEMPWTFALPSRRVCGFIVLLSVAST